MGMGSSSSSTQLPSAPEALIASLSNLGLPQSWGPEGTEGSACSHLGSPPTHPSVPAELREALFIGAPVSRCTPHLCNRHLISAAAPWPELTLLWHTACSLSPKGCRGKEFWHLQEPFHWRPVYFVPGSLPSWQRPPGEVHPELLFIACAILALQWAPAPGNCARPPFGGTALPSADPPTHGQDTHGRSCLAATFSGSPRTQPRLHNLESGPDPEDAPLARMPA